MQERERISNRNGPELWVQLKFFTGCVCVLFLTGVPVRLAFSKHNKILSDLTTCKWSALCIRAMVSSSKHLQQEWGTSLSKTWSWKLPYDISTAWLHTSNTSANLMSGIPSDFSTSFQNKEIQQNNVQWPCTSSCLKLNYNCTIIETERFNRTQKIYPFFLISK